MDETSFLLCFAWNFLAGNKVFKPLNPYLKSNPTHNPNTNTNTNPTP